MSFFETNVDHFVKKYSVEVGKDLVKDKFDWMFDRITSAKAKELVKPLYEGALRQLKKNGDLV